MRYVATIEYFPNCRACDNGYGTDPLFFNEKEELMEFVKNNLSDQAVDNIYNCETGRKCDFNYVSYVTSRHCVSECRITWMSIEYKLIDDGHGNKIWEELQ